MQVGEEMPAIDRRTEADKRTDMTDKRTADTGQTDHRQIVWMNFLNVLRCGGHSGGNRKTFPSNAQLSKNSRKLESRTRESVDHHLAWPGRTCSATL